MFSKILSLPLKPVITCGKSSISDVWQGFEFAFVAINDFRKKIHVRCLTRFWIGFCNLYCDKRDTFTNQRCWLGKISLFNNCSFWIIKTYYYSWKILFTHDIPRNTGGPKVIPERFFGSQGFWGSQRLEEVSRAPGIPGDARGPGGFPRVPEVPGLCPTFSPCHSGKT